MLKDLHWLWYPYARVYKIILEEDTVKVASTLFIAGDSVPSQNTILETHIV